MRSLNIGFVHPDLGIGGAERLVVDAATALRAAGHHVTIHTSHHDRERSFEETRDGTLAVRAHDSLFPRHIAGRLLAPCAIARTLVAARQARRAHYDVVFCDLVAHSVPAVRRPGTRVAFYCHYPDKLLAPPGGVLHRWYRRPIDALEERATAMADLILVNSRFTAAAFEQAYPGCAHVRPTLLYPGVRTERFGGSQALAGSDEPILLLAISRLERKKNLELAVGALARLRSLVPADVAARLRLCVAGGYDERLEDNRQALQRLRAEIARHGLGGVVAIEANVSDERKLELLHACRAVIYTPGHEHFGYVPLEAMASGRPVAVCDTGGPTETVVHGMTGLVCAPTAEAFASQLAPLVTDVALARRMGVAGVSHVAAAFSMDAFGGRLRAIVDALAAS